MLFVSFKYIDKKRALRKNPPTEIRRIQIPFITYKSILSGEK